MCADRVAQLDRHYLDCSRWFNVADVPLGRDLFVLREHRFQPRSCSAVQHRWILVHCHILRYSRSR